MDYESSANELKLRIVKLIRNHEELLEISDVWRLFDYSDFNCGDLDPSFAQASWAFNQAKIIINGEI